MSISWKRFSGCLRVFIRSIGSKFRSGVVILILYLVCGLVCVLIIGIGVMVILVFWSCLIIFLILLRSIC